MLLPRAFGGFYHQPSRFLLDINPEAACYGLASAHMRCFPYSKVLAEASQPQIGQVGVHYDLAVVQADAVCGHGQADDAMDVIAGRRQERANAKVVGKLATYGAPVSCMVLMLTRHA